MLVYCFRISGILHVLTYLMLLRTYVQVPKRVLCQVCELPRYVIYMMFKQPTTFIAYTIDVGTYVYVHIILTQSKSVAIRESGACIVKYTGTVHVT